MSGAAACGKTEVTADAPAPGPHWAQREYVTTYHVQGYALADAMRPQSSWGRRSFTVKAETLGQHTEPELIEAARQGAPEGYRLTRIVLREPGRCDRVLWSAPPVDGVPRRLLVGPTPQLAAARLRSAQCADT